MRLPCLLLPPIKMSSLQPNKPATENATLYPVPEAEYIEIVQNSEIFLQKLQNFHRSFGTKFKIPTIGGSALDLHLLFVQVTSRGGIDQVVRGRKWKEVVMVFNYPSTITSASFILRKYYQSLLYHFEQVYYLRKKVHYIPATDSARRIVNGSSALQVVEDGATMHQNSATPDLEPDGLVMGTIDAKFDCGYLVTVNLGSEQLKGVLYHIPTASAMSQSYNNSATPHRSRNRFGDPSRPKANRSGYEISFAENYNRTKPLFHRQEIGHQQENWALMEQTHQG